MSEKKFTVIIPARGGSKRFGGKNTQLLLGKPLLAYPIEAAKKAKLVDRVIVSTDDEEIARIAMGCGAEVPFMRPAELAGDATPVAAVIKFTLEELERTENYRADYVVLLQPTTPIIEPEQVDAAIALALEKNADSVVNLCEVDTMNHPYNVREILSDGTARFWQEEFHYSTLGTERPKFYHAANLWLSSYDTIMAGRLEGNKNYPIIVPAIYSFDIDFKEDLERLEAILSHRAKNG